MYEVCIGAAEATGGTGNGLRGAGEVGEEGTEGNVVASCAVAVSSGVPLGIIGDAALCEVVSAYGVTFEGK